MDIWATHRDSFFHAVGVVDAIHKVFVEFDFVCNFIALVHLNTNWSRIICCERSLNTVVSLFIAQSSLILTNWNIRLDARVVGLFDTYFDIARVYFYCLGFGLTLIRTWCLILTLYWCRAVWSISIVIFCLILILNCIIIGTRLINWTRTILWSSTVFRHCTISIICSINRICIISEIINLNGTRSIFNLCCIICTLSSFSWWRIRRDRLISGIWG